MILAALGDGKLAYAAQEGSKEKRERKLHWAGMNLISHYKLKNDQIVTSFMDVSTQIQDVGSYPVDQPVHWVDW